MSFRESFTGETYGDWAARIAEDVRELERVAQYAELASYAVPMGPLWEDVRPGLTRCESCGHYVLASGRCLGCEVAAVKGRAHV